MLADQGQNESSGAGRGRAERKLRSWIERTRKELDWPHLAVVVKSADPRAAEETSPPHTDWNAQEWVIREYPQCFPGPDYDPDAPCDRRWHSPRHRRDAKSSHLVDVQSIGFSILPRRQAVSSAIGTNRLSINLYRSLDESGRSNY